MELNTTFEFNDEDVDVPKELSTPRHKSLIKSTTPRRVRSTPFNQQTLTFTAPRIFEKTCGKKQEICTAGNASNAASNPFESEKENFVQIMTPCVVQHTSLCTLSKTAKKTVFHCARAGLSDEDNFIPLTTPRVVRHTKAKSHEILHYAPTSCSDQIFPLTTPRVLKRKTSTSIEVDCVQVKSSTSGITVDNFESTSSNCTNVQMDDPFSDLPCWKVPLTRVKSAPSNRSSTAAFITKKSVSFSTNKPTCATLKSFFVDDVDEAIFTKRRLTFVPEEEDC